MKIRAYDKEKDKLVYSDLMPESYEFKFAPSGDLEVLRHGKKIDAEIDLCSEILDCNGCEIYQNDILKIESSEKYISRKDSKVKFDGRGFRVNNVMLGFICSAATSYEIVGNTHTKAEV